MVATPYDVVRDVANYISTSNQIDAVRSKWRNRN